MGKKTDAHIFKGMSFDLDPLKQPADHLTYARNVRITSRGESTALAVTPEKSTKEVTFEGISKYTKIPGTYVGHCVLNQYVVVFTIVSDDSLPDKIFLVEKFDDSYSLELLYEGNLGFDVDCHIDAIGIYENEAIQKVYWVDGVNQPRMINIVSERRYERDDSWDDTSFDFSPELSLDETVTVTKEFGNGTFPAGVIQYVFTYYNKYGQETAIAWQSPLFYICFTDRGGSPEETVSCRFNVKIENLDKKYDYVRLYSIIRTSLDATPTCKRVRDMKISECDHTGSGSSSSYYCTLVDDGTIGDNVDPTELLYLGSEEITAKTIAQKDGTLFLGDITVTRPMIESGMANSIRTLFLEDESDTIDTGTRTIYLPDYKDDTYYPQQYMLNCVTSASGSLDTPMTFKYDEWYRLGVQFQYKNGKWTDPIYLTDMQFTGDNYSSILSKGQTWKLPVFSRQIATESDLGTLISTLYSMGYRKARGVVVLPTVANRKIITQGILCPAVYNNRDNQNNSPYMQSSWFIRPFPGTYEQPDTIMDHNKNDWSSQYGTLDVDKCVLQYSGWIVPGIDARAEIEGVPREIWYSTTYVPDEDGEFTDFSYVYRHYYGTLDAYYEFTPQDTSTNTFFGVDTNWLTFHSPEVQWDEDLHALDYTSLKFRVMGVVEGFNSAGDTLVETSSPPVDASGAGFIKNTFVALDSSRTISCYCGFEDNLVDDDGDDVLEAYDKGECVKYYLYPWQRTGSLNNDIPRGANQGTQTAVLSKKIWSDAKIGLDTKLFNCIGNEKRGYFNSASIGLFNSDEISVIKILYNTDSSDDSYKTYYGNIDTVINPATPYTPYWYCDSDEWTVTGGGISKVVYGGLWSERGIPDSFSGKSSHIGDNNNSLRKNKFSVRMKYKSTPHVVVAAGSDENGSNVYTIGLRLSNTNYGSYVDAQVTKPCLLLGEIYRDIDTDNLFEGTNEDILKSHTWLVAGEAVSINLEESATTAIVAWKWGDCFQQRFDFLKTYSFTSEDENQVIEVGSFLVESRVNCDGRYDRNKGLTSNLSVSPQNFNLHNPVYNQRDNFFTYRILDSSYYDITEYHNQVTWTTEHAAVADIDNWAHVTLASTIDTDGSRGNVTAIRLFNDNLFVFQDESISRILFNSRVQLNTSDGVPIEISNNYKVDGTQVISGNLGCDNIESILVAPSGIYFTDTRNSDLYVTNGGEVRNISASLFVSSWFKSLSTRPRLYYDFNEGDLYVNSGTSESVLNYSETLSEFVSFLDYDNAIAMFNIGDRFIGLTKSTENSQVSFWEMFQGSTICNLFDDTRPVSLSFISNLEPGLCKTFTNLDMRVDWRDLSDLGDGSGVNYDRAANSYEFFDTLQVSNEYQDTGDVELTELRERPSNLKNKFRVWRIRVPRDKTNARHRITNPWARFTLEKDMHPHPFILHDLDVTYYV